MPVLGSVAGLGRSRATPDALLPIHHAITVPESPRWATLSGKALPASFRPSPGVIGQSAHPCGASCADVKVVAVARVSRVQVPSRLVDCAPLYRHGARERGVFDRPLAGQDAGNPESGGRASRARMRGQPLARTKCFEGSLRTARCPRFAIRKGAARRSSNRRGLPRLVALPLQNLPAA